MNTTRYAALLSRPTTVCGSTARARRATVALVAVAGLALSAPAQQVVLPGNTGPTQPGGPPLLNPSGSIPAFQPVPEPTGEGMYTLPAFAEGVELKEIVDYVINTLKINVVVDSELTGTVVINRAISVERDELLKLLNDLLEQQDFMIFRESSGWYQIIKISGDIPVSDSTTRMISTPNMKPSSLRPAVEAVFPPSRAASNTRVVYLDDLGLIMVTDTPRVVEAVERVIEQIRAEQNKQDWFRIELTNIAAPAALDRAIGMVGGTATGSTQPDPTGQFGGQFQQPGAAAPGAGRTSSLITNIEARLKVDVQGNGLIFYGRTEELAMVQKIISQIDVATHLESRKYDAGAYAEQIANLAKGQGLGEVVVVEDDSQNQNQNQFFGFNPNLGQQTQQLTATGGSQMIVDVKRGQIIYFGTPQQHQILSRLIEDIGLQSDAITIETYALQNADAEETADLLRQLILGQTESGGGGLLPTGGAQQPIITPFGFAQQPETGVGALFGDEYTSIIADVANNSILVRAPANLQPQYDRLISGLDMRRQQVYIKAYIVSISNTATSRLAFETQLINAGGDPVFQTNFGLNQAGAGTDITDPRSPLATLTGLTTAVIQSKYVPIIINATATDIDGRILATPQLLVNDNFEAEIQSIDQQPTTTTTQTTGNPAQTSFGGYEDAGTTLRVTPSISRNGWIRMEYEITLSSFTAAGANGVPPPKQNNTLRADAVTIPSDSTIVVGGITVENSRNTIIKVPLLGDIPVLGHLFRDTNKNDTDSILYVFITPYIMADPSFQDMRLLTRGPQTDTGLGDGIPQIQPRMIEILSPTPPRMLEP